MTTTRMKTQWAGLQQVSLLASIPALLLTVSGPVLAQSEPVATAITTTTAPTSTASEADVVVAEDVDDWLVTEQLVGQSDVGDFVVGPGRTDITVSPGETVVVPLSVTNRISDDRIFRLVVEDIAGSNDPSQSIRLLGDAIGPYSIRDYIELPDTEFRLDAGERARIPVAITIPPDAEPGGFYGAIFVSTVQSESDARAANAAQSPIVARIGSLFFVTVPGEVMQAGETLDATVLNDNWWHESGPIPLGVTFENTGSVHLTPSATLVITNLFGEEVGVEDIPMWYVLPQSIRLREITWNREFLFGRYTAEFTVNRGYDDLVDVETVSFWVLPWRILLGAFAMFFIVFYGVRTFFRRFEFKRKDS